MSKLIKLSIASIAMFALVGANTAFGQWSGEAGFTTEVNLSADPAGTDAALNDAASPLTTDTYWGLAYDWSGDDISVSFGIGSLADDATVTITKDALTVTAYPGEIDFAYMVNDDLTAGLTHFNSNLFSNFKVYADGAAGDITYSVGYTMGMASNVDVGATIDLGVGYTMDDLEVSFDYQMNGPAATANETITSGMALGVDYSTGDIAVGFDYITEPDNHLRSGVDVNTYTKMALSLGYGDDIGFDYTSEGFEDDAAAGVEVAVTTMNLSYTGLGFSDDADTTVGYRTWSRTDGGVEDVANAFGGIYLSVDVSF